MTADDFFDFCLGLLGYTRANSGTTIEYFLKMLNQCLSECFEVEQGERAMEGIALLDAPQYVLGYSEPLGYTMNTLLNVIALGCATMMATVDEDTVQAAYYSNKYDMARMKPRRAVYMDVEDCCDGGAL